VQVEPVKKYCPRELDRTMDGSAVLNLPMGILMFDFYFDFRSIYHPRGHAHLSALVPSESK